MLSRLSNTQKGIFLALFGFWAFVISDSSAKWLSASYETPQVIGWLYLFALFFGLAFSPVLGGIKATLKTQKRKLHIGRGLFNLGLAVTVVIAFRHLPFTSVYPILFLSPFLITIMAIPIYKEKVALVNWLIIAIGFSGVLIAFQPWNNALSPWLIAPLFTTLFICGLSLCARPLDHKETILSLSFYPAITNTLVLFPYALYAYGAPAVADLWIFALGGFMLVCAMSGVAYACRLARFAIISPLQYTQLILVFIIGYFIFEERPDAYMITGSAIIGLSGILLALSKKDSIPAEH